MTKVQLLLLTAAIPESESAELVRRIGGRARGVGIDLVAVIPREASPGLTRRQEEVLREMASGTPMKQIARKLGVSVKTVESHRGNLVERLGIRDIPGLVRYALRTGILPVSWLMG